MHECIELILCTCTKHKKWGVSLGKKTPRGAKGVGQGRKNDGPQLASARACGPGNIAIASGCFSLDAPHTRIRYHKKWTHQVRHPDVSEPRAVARPTYRIDLRLPCKATYGHRRVWLVFSLRPHATTTATTNFRPSRAPDHAPRISGDSEVRLEIHSARGQGHPPASAPERCTSARRGTSASHNPARTRCPTLSPP